MPKQKRFLACFSSKPGRFLLVLCLSCLLGFAPALGRTQPPGVASRPAPGGNQLIPIEQQPFYPQLQRDADNWSDVVLDQVVGDSPRSTLLNFYAVMADVGHRADRLGQTPDAGRRGGVSRQEQIDDTTLLFNLAVKALDASAFAESVRSDMADEAAIQLKHVLDYVLTHSRQPIDIPDVEGMKQRNDLRSTPTDSWRIPGTAITLTSDLEGDPENESFYFSAGTVASAARCTTRFATFP